MPNDNNNNIPKSCSRLEEIANEARAKLIRDNVYQDVAGQRYTSTHVNATQGGGGIDDRQNQKGKGTGEFLDTSKGGGSLDVNGRADVGGSGRKNLLTLNKYSADEPYDCFLN